MKKLTLTLLGIIALLVLSGCDNKSNPQALTYKYTPAEVYTATCAHCHGVKGEGMVEKRGPSLTRKGIQELELDLYDIKNGGLGQSTATEHDVMEHNMKKLSQKGYDYDIKAMSRFIFENFHNKE